MSPAPHPILIGNGWPPDRDGGLERYFRDLLLALGSDGGPEPAGVVLGPASDRAGRLAVPARITDPLPRRVQAVMAAVTDLTRPTDPADPAGCVLDSHFALNGFGPAVLAPRLHRLPLVVHFQGPWAEESAAAGATSWLVHTLKHRIERAVIRRADAIVVLSPAFAHLVVQRYRADPWRARVIAPPVDVDRFSPVSAAQRRRLRSDRGLGDDDRLVVCVRRLVPRMGIDTLIDAWPAVSHALAATGARAVLRIVGDGPARPDLAARIDRDHSGADMALVGRVADADLIDWYRAADASVVPTRALEGFGLVAVESMACGTPAIVTDCDGLRAAVAGLPAGVDGWPPDVIVPPEDPEALARRLIDALTGTAPLPARTACRTHAEGFHPRLAARAHRDLYAEAASTRAQRAATSSTRRAATAGARPMRVVMVDHTARPSGAELNLARLMPALDAIGDRVRMHVVLGEDGPLVDLLTRGGHSVEVVTLPLGVRHLARGGLTPAGTLAAAAGTVQAAAALTRRLRELAPDLVHTNSLKAGLVGGVAARLAGIGVVWHVHDRVTPADYGARATRLFRAGAATVPRLCVANSAATRAVLGPIDAPVVVVPSALDPTLTSPRATPPVPTDRAVSASPATPGPLRIGMVGRLAPWKGQDLFLRAFARAGMAKGSRPTTAVIIGAALFGEQAWEDHLHDLVDELGLTGRVEFRGHRSDIAAELARLDMVVHASTSPEPFGQVVIEAMAAGVPVVAADAGGPTEILDHDRTGVLYPMGDVDALARAVASLHDDSSRRARLAGAARAAVGRYDARLVADDLVTCWEWALDRHPANGVGARPTGTVAH